MITLRKNGVKLEFVKNVSGIIIHIHEKGKVSSFCIVPPGNIFILTKGKWDAFVNLQKYEKSRVLDKNLQKHKKLEPDETKLEVKKRTERPYIDPVDKASVEMTEIIAKTAHIKFLNYEKFFVEKVIYEFFNNLDLFDWFPGYGEAVFIEMLHNKMVAHYKNGKTEDFDMTKAANSVILSFDEPMKLPAIKLPPLPPLNPIVPIGPIAASIPKIISLPPLVTMSPIKPITLPPLGPMSPIKSLPLLSPIDTPKSNSEVKLIVSNNLSVPININDEQIEVSTSLPLIDNLENSAYDVTTEELSDTDEE
jgi:hypothetical protein